MPPLDALFVGYVLGACSLAAGVEHAIPRAVYRERLRARLKQWCVVR